MGANQYVGVGVWLAQKTEKLKDAWDIYQATKSPNVPYLYICSER